MMFKNPIFLWFLLGLIPMAVWYIFRDRRQQTEVKFSSAESAMAGPRGWRVYARHILPVLRLLGLGFLLVAMARPQTEENNKEQNVEGIDIMLALDISGSMLAQDFKPDRLGAAKKVAKEFIEGRPDDRIGLVTFAAESFTQCPLTTDHTVLLDMFKDVESGMLADGTAIGLGLSTAVDGLHQSDAKSKVVILLTDGINRMGEVPPLSAAEVAKVLGIRVYTIGVGSRGMAPIPVPTPFGTQMRQMKVEINEVELKEIAEMTGGKYFRATDEKKLSEIYAQIDELEKSKIEEIQFRTTKEEFLPFLVFGLILLIGELGLQHTIFRTIP